MNTPPRPLRWRCTSCRWIGFDADLLTCLRHLPIATPKPTLEAAWRRARAACGLEHVHLHDLRHSTASELINAGVDLYTVGAVLGHKDPRSTQAPGRRC